jgi:antitoxin (DNA-binding transcriptional repressor) of toxin-antitoxin stability system
MERVTAKQLHLETKAVLDQVEAGQTIDVVRSGRVIGRLEPVSSDAVEPSWDEIMKEAWAAQKTVQDIQPNPVLQERKRRRR